MKRVTSSLVSVPRRGFLSLLRADWDELAEYARTFLGFRPPKGILVFATPRAQGSRAHAGYRFRPPKGILVFATDRYLCQFQDMDKGHFITGFRPPKGILVFATQ
jgi:hypothetical protein